MPIKNGEIFLFIKKLVMEKITFEDVCWFIIYNSDNTKMMDKINQITFAFSSKFNDYKKIEETIDFI